MQCPRCKVEVVGKFCGKCGTPVKGSAKAGPPVIRPQAPAISEPTSTAASPGVAAFSSLGDCRCGAGADKIQRNGVCSQCNETRIGPCPVCDQPANEVTASGACSLCGAKRIKRHHIVLSASLASVTDQCNTAHENQDWHTVRVLSVNGKTAVLLVDCDGVSGSTQGRAAAEAAVKAVSTTVERALTVDKVSPRDAVKLSVRAAQRAVKQVPWQPGVINPVTHQADQAPSCTLVVALILEGRLYYSWRGDSRLYLVVGGKAEALTVDDSYVNYLIAGTATDPPMTREAATAKAKEERLSRGLAHFVGDLDDPDTLDPHLEDRDLPQEYHLVGTSDGVAVYDDDGAQVAAIVSAPSRTAIDKAIAIVDYAIKCGGIDNTTASVYSSSR